MCICLQSAVFICFGCSFYAVLLHHSLRLLQDSVRIDALLLSQRVERRLGVSPVLLNILHHVLHLGITLRHLADRCLRILCRMNHSCYLADSLHCPAVLHSAKHFHKRIDHSFPPPVYSVCPESDSLLS